MRDGSFDLKMRNLKLEIIDTRRCFPPADSLQNVIKFHQVKRFCLYITLYFVPVTLKTSKCLLIRHPSFCKLLGPGLYQEI